MGKSYRTEIVQIAGEVLRELAPYGAYIKNAAKTTDSVYIAFSCPQYGQMRISDHRGRKGSHYTWNITINGDDRQVGNLCYASHENAAPFIAYMKTRFSLIDQIKTIGTNL